MVLRKRERARMVLRKRESKNGLETGGERERKNEWYWGSGRSFLRKVERRSEDGFEKGREKDRGEREIRNAS